MACAWFVHLGSWLCRSPLANKVARQGEISGNSGEFNSTGRKLIRGCNIATVEPAGSERAAEKLRDLSDVNKNRLSAG
jgi:hypothetical protein